MLNRIKRIDQITKIEYGLMATMATIAIGSGFAPVERETSVLFAAMFLGITIGLWLSHLLTMLHTAAVQSDTQNNA
ncbi:MAG: hypothetical protein U5K28_10930 [Halobacteriales archaeon]|nr:hypothetical protein [Halobacteriales archaeon]